ncbi:uncharacterized protein LOC122498824 isoform X2 [Leptopilina heterotoma]|uniref:uncharacterized protein LOC122498824 isoform X2 n=1 Tax=Leptopilina heterotoma TaxID=63436 RepID=UPI001CA88B35|nr:uncharacterized protein LOC122498824 isoform X2 [Leptopilina heterotoma]
MPKNHKVRREVPETKKYLLFPQGSNVQLIYCMTIGTYARPGGFFTMGVTAGLAYELPHKRTVLFRKPAEVYHRRSRRELYQKLELMLKTQGKDGKECVLKALCNAGKRKRTKEGKGSFIEEILHSIFTLPSGSYHLDPKTEYEKAHETDVDCNKAFPSCADSIFD